MYACPCTIQMCSQATLVFISFSHEIREFGEYNTYRHVHITTQHTGPVKGYLGIRLTNIFLVWNWPIQYIQTWLYTVQVCQQALGHAWYTGLFTGITHRSIHGLLGNPVPYLYDIDVYIDIYTWPIMHRSTHGPLGLPVPYLWRWRIHTFLHMTQSAQVCWQGTEASSTVLMWSWLIHTYFDSLCAGLLTGNLSIQYRQTSWTAAYTHRSRFIRLTMWSWRIHVYEVD